MTIKALSPPDQQTVLCCGCQNAFLMKKNSRKWSLILDWVVLTEKQGGGASS